MHFIQNTKDSDGYRVYFLVFIIKMSQLSENSENQNQKGILNVSIEQELQTAYLDYAMSVIVSRAIPDVRDGLKPVQRRILYAMHDNGQHYNKPYKKSARVVGEVISKYHPHGEAAIYLTLVRMAQSFSMGTKLIDGQGNFGSIDDDPPAAMRYTEARMERVAHYLMEDIDKDTVDFRENYDGTEVEPVILPAHFPNVLVNGSEGIAVGMATNIPPHNLGEVIDACLLMINNPHPSDEELILAIPGPDFPTNGVMVGRGTITKAMITGRGSIILRGRAHIEQIKNNKEAIVITEIPYQVVKSRLVEKIAELVKEKRVEGITNIRDESNKKGIRIVVEVRKDVSSEIVLNYLYKYTPLQSFFAVNNLVLQGNKPQVMGVRKIIESFLEFRESIIVRRLNFLLRKSRDRAHIMIGLHVAVDSIDRVISIIRNAVDTNEAKTQLSAEKWFVSENISTLIDLVCDEKNMIIDGYFKFTEEQVKSILELRLARLTGLERDKIVAELTSLGEEIKSYLSTLADRTKILEIMTQELSFIKEKFAVPRRTSIEDTSLDVSIEDFIEKEDMLVMVTGNGYIKRNSLTNYIAQRRGGKGKFGIQTAEDDDVNEVLISNTHANIMFFSNRGKVYRLKTHQIPLGSNQAKGRAIVNLLPLDKEEKINNFLTLPVNKEDWKNYDLVFATKKGNVRRSNINDFSSINANGKIAIMVDYGDALIGVKLARHDENILLATKKGIAVRFPMEELRIIKSRTSDGVRGITLQADDEVVSLSIVGHSENDSSIKEKYLMIPVDQRVKLAHMESQPMKEQIDSWKKDGTLATDIETDNIVNLINQEQFILTINESGFGKRTSVYEYRITGRGGKGIINMDTSRGDIVASFIAHDVDDLVLVSTQGKVIRCSAGSISIIGRNTKGVRVFNLSEGEKVTSVTKIANIDKQIEDNELSSALNDDSANI